MSIQPQSLEVKDDTSSTNKIMQDESNPVKDYLFNFIKSENNIQELISQSRFTEIIDIILDGCYDKVISMGEKEESIGVLATGILHYLLTNALITSQRKIEYNGVEIDIIIPDLKTLETDPKRTLVLCILQTINQNKIKQKIDQLQKIQPIKENIWIIATEKLDFENRTYVIEKQNASFSKIIADIAQFVNVQGQSKFKILRI